jgi:hypothetical protein
MPEKKMNQKQLYNLCVLAITFSFIGITISLMTMMLFSNYLGSMDWYCPELEHLKDQCNNPNVSDFIEQVEKCEIYYEEVINANCNEWQLRRYR